MQVGFLVSVACIIQTLQVVARLESYRVVDSKTNEFYTCLGKVMNFVGITKGFNEAINFTSSSYFTTKKSKYIENDAVIIYNISLYKGQNLQQIIDLVTHMQTNKDDLLMLSSSYLPIAKKIIGSLNVTDSCTWYVPLTEVKLYKSCVIQYKDQFYHANNSFYSLTVENKRVKYHITVCKATLKQSQPFPVEILFNSFLNGNLNLSKYLCNEDSTADKCCRCSQTCHENCCIDIFWQDFDRDGLNEYISYFLKRKEENKLKKFCKPIFPLREGHYSEYIYFMSPSFNAGNNGVICADRTVFLSSPLYSRKTGEYYFNKNCGKVYGVADLEPINVTVLCKNMQPFTGRFVEFTYDLQFKLQDCTYLIKAPENKLTSNNCTDILCSKEITDNYPQLCSNVNINCNECQKLNRRLIANCNTGCSNRFCKRTTEEHQIKFDIYMNEKGRLIIHGLNISFPVLEFFGLNTLPPSSPHFDVNSYLCKNTYRYSTTNECYCDCDKECVRYKTCCMDFYWNQLNPIPINEYKNLLLSTSSQYKDHECQKVIPFAKHPNNMHYQFVTTCLSNATEESKNLCIVMKKDVLATFIPVVGLQDKYLYRNIYCAICNNIFKVVPVKIVIICSDVHHHSITQLDFENQCWFSIDPHDSLKFKIRTCSRISTRCSKSNTDSPLCDSYQGFYQGYRNYHCSTCGFVTKRKETAPRENCQRKLYTYWDLLIAFSSIDIDMNVKNVDYFADIMSVKTSSYEEVEFCKTQELFKLFTKNCYTNNDLTLDEQYIVSYKDSMGNIISMQAVKTSTFMQCFGKQEMNIFVIKNISKGIEFDELALSRINLTSNGDSSSSLFYQDEHEEVYTLRADQMTQLYFSIHPYPKDAFKIVFTHSRVPVINKGFNVDFKNAFSDGRLCYRPISVLEKDVLFDLNCNVIYQNEFFNRTDVTLWATTDKSSLLVKHIELCRKFYLTSSCNLKSIEGNMTIDGGNVTVSKYDGANEYETYQVHEYKPINEGIVVCKPKMNGPGRSNGSLIYNIYICFIYVCLVESVTSFTVR